MIISVDTGNKHMKTENCEFNSGVEILDTLPGDMEEVIEYEGKYYVTTNRRISYTIVHFDVICYCKRVILSRKKRRLTFTKFTGD